MSKAPRLLGGAAALEGSAALFAALGDETRLQLVARLCERGPMSIARLADGLAITRQAVAKHLQVLAEAGVLCGHRRGRERIWEVAPEGLDDARAALDQISRQWDESLERLRILVEEGAGARG